MEGKLPYWKKEREGEREGGKEEERSPLELLDSLGIKVTFIFKIKFRIKTLKEGGAESHQF